MAVHESQNLQSTERTSLCKLIRDNGSSREPKFAVHRTRVKPEVATVSLARGGIRGWPVCQDRDRTRAIESWGIPQDVDAECEHISISRILLNSNIQLSLSLAQHLLFETLFYWFSSKYSVMTKYRKFLSFFTTLDRSNISFSPLRILLFTSKSDTGASNWIHPGNSQSPLQSQGLT